MPKPELPPVARWIESALAVAITVAAVAWSLGIVQVLSLSLYTEQFVAAVLALALALAYVHLPARRDTTRSHVPALDWILALIAFVAAGYLAVRYESLVDLVLLRPTDGIVAGGVVILLLLEALRRATGWALPVIVCCFIVYALVAGSFPGQLQGRSTDVQQLTAYLAIDTNGMLGVPIVIGATVVTAFILFGNLLVVSHASTWFTEVSLTLMGRFRGGAAKISVLASALFGSISGSAVANVVATGVITIPMIRRSGYAPHQAAAIEAVASTGGQLMPPVMGASAFLMAEFLQISYGAVVLAALVPALLYYLAVFIQVDLDAARAGINRVDSLEIPTLRSVLPGVHFLLPFAVLIGGLFFYGIQPEEAALWSAAALLVLSFAFGYKGRRPGILAVIETLRGTGIGVLEIILITAAAGLVIGVLAVSGLGFNLTLLLVSLGGENKLLLLGLAAIVCIVLGMGLPTVGVYVLLAALVAPALVKVGVDPTAAHLYVMYFGMMSMITPPVAMAAYAAAGLARADFMRTGLESVRLGWSAFIVPVLFVFSPTLILKGEPASIALAVATAVLGIWLTSIGLVGYFMRPLAAWIRLLFVIAGLLSLIPAEAFPHAVLTDIVGAGMGAVLIGWEWLAARRQTRLTTLDGSLRTALR
jgi:TRAP transporter 4TM/12TM fusion protein